MKQIVTSPVPHTKIKKVPNGLRKALYELFYRVVPDKEGRFIRYYPWVSLEYVWFFPPSWKRAYLLHLTETMKRDLGEYHDEVWTNYPIEKCIQVYNGRTKINLMINILLREYPEKVGTVQVFPYHKTNPFWNDTGKSRCIICLQEMTPKNKYQMVCSQICRNKVYIKNRRDAEITKIWLTKNPTYHPPEESDACITCGKPLPDMRRSHRKFCGTACRVAHHRKKD